MAFSRARLQQKIATYPATDTYWVAYSGGLDSTVLLHALAASRQQLSFSLHAIHTDHGLQRASPDWAVHCVKQCAALDVPLTTCKLELQARKGESLESLARNARYRAFAGIVGKGDMLLTAHHADDQVETVFLQLLRGAGVAGLAAMPELTRWQSAWLARPLIEDSRASLQHYAEKHELVWVEDSSNQDFAFDRNYLRHKIMPELKQRWPGLLRTVPRSARHCATAAHLLEEQAADILAKVDRPQRWQLATALLNSVSGAQQPHLLMSWIRSCGLQVPAEINIRRILSEVVTARADAVPLVVWKQGELRRYRETLYLMPVLPVVPENWSVLWDTTKPLSLPAGLGTLTGNFAQTVTVRFRYEGLRCKLYGRSGTRTFKQVCQDLGIPAWLRGRLPLVFVGDQLLAIADIAICEGYREQLDSDGSGLIWDREDYL